MLMFNISLYHVRLDTKQALVSLFNTGVFVFDMVTDVLYLSNRGLDRVLINENQYNFKRYLIISICIPLGLELFKVIRTVEGSLPFKIITWISVLIDQEKCLYMPKKLTKLRKYHWLHGKPNPDKKIKFVIFEDSV